MIAFAQRKHPWEALASPPQHLPLSSGPGSTGLALCGTADPQARLSGIAHTALTTVKFEFEPLEARTEFEMATETFGLLGSEAKLPLSGTCNNLLSAGH